MSNDQSDTDDTFLYELERESKVLKLAAHLKLSEKVYVRRRAAEMLGNISSIPDPDERQHVIDTLVNAVETDDDDSVRAAAIETLYQRGEEEFEYLLSELSGMEFSEATDRTTEQLLIEWLSSDHPEFRMVAASALGRRSTTEAAPELVRSLTDPDPRVRERAARACGSLDDPRVIEPLSKRLESDRPTVAEAAATALGSIGTEKAIQKLVPLVQSDEESLRLTAVDTLGQLRSVKTVIALSEALDDNSTNVKRVAMLSLLDLLSNAPAEQAEQIRQTVIEQVKRVDVTETIPALVEIIEGGRRERYRQTAIWLLSRIVGEDHRTAAIECLVETLDDPDDVTAQLAANGLEKLGGPELEKRLRVYLNRERGTDESRARAEEILDTICDNSSSELVTTGVDYTYINDPSDYTGDE
jgi:HEAT repeat protein